jgi:hypothetical protein
LFLASAQKAKIPCQRTKANFKAQGIAFDRSQHHIAIEQARSQSQSQSQDSCYQIIHYAIMKLQISSAILLWVLSDPTGTADAWIPTTHLAVAGTATARRSTFTCTTVPFFRKGAGVQLYSSNSDGGEDDEDDGCADEEECEIDWGAMPGFDDDEEEEANQAQASPSSTSDNKQGTETTAKIQNEQQQEEDDDEHVPNPLGPKQVRSLRLRLEMQWQMTEAAEECDSYHPATCGSDPCPDCKGRGWNDCRFCRGTTVMFMRQPGGGIVQGENNNNNKDMASQSSFTPNDKSSFISCNICQKGTEACKSCQGSGWVSGWAKLQLSK